MAVAVWEVSEKECATHHQLPDNEKASFQVRHKELAPVKYSAWDLVIPGMAGMEWDVLMFLTVYKQSSISTYSTLIPITIAT